MHWYKRLPSPTCYFGSDQPHLVEGGLFYLSWIRTLDFTPWPRWGREVADSVYAGIGCRRNQKWRYGFARHLVLMGVSPETACEIALTYCEYIQGEWEIRRLARRKDIRWQARTSALMHTKDWWDKQHSYVDVLDGEFVTFRH